jgi:signal transduction histidine kinase
MVRSVSNHGGATEAEHHERARLAAELHDDPIQVLSAAQWRLQALAPRLEGADRTTVEEVGQALAAVQQRLRTLMFELSPPALEADGLVASIGDLLAATFAHTDTRAGITATLDRTDTDAIPLPVAALAYRLTAEAVRNVRAHAAASTVDVTVERETGVLVTVRDDGVGVAANPAVRPGHGGTVISASLATSAGGWWEMNGTPGVGTTVRFWLPLELERSARLQ